MHFTARTFPHQSCTFSSLSVLVCPVATSTLLFSMPSSPFLLVAYYVNAQYMHRMYRHCNTCVHRVVRSSGVENTHISVTRCLLSHVSPLHSDHLLHTCLRYRSIPHRYYTTVSICMRNHVAFIAGAAQRV